MSTQPVDQVRSNLSINIRADADPPFYELDSKRFERLCGDLLFKEADIATADIYGEPGQSQDGIDIIGHRSDNGIEVGQCKCYQDFPPRKIREASDKFLEYWDTHWKDAGVTRFILFVASSLDSRQRQDEIVQQKKRFRNYGIKYEAWSATTIRNKLRPHPGLVGNYLEPPDHWIRVICGSTQPAPVSGDIPDIQVNIIVQRVLIEKLRELASEQVQNALRMMRSAWSEGNTAEVAIQIASIKESEDYTYLSDETKAELLNFEASFVLQTENNIEHAKELQAIADSICHAVNRTRVKALITYREHGADEALDILLQDADINSLNFRASILLENGRLQEAIKVLNEEILESERNAETYRLSSLANILSHELDVAYTNIQHALVLEPNSMNLRFVAGVVRYYQALSPAALPDSLVPWPEPIDWVLVKRDKASVYFLREAQEHFESFLAKPAGGPLYLDAWYLASLTADFDKQTEAEQYCNQLLKQDPTYPPAIAWASARRLRVDYSVSRRELEKLVGNESATISHLLALLNCYYETNDYPRALNLLDQVRPQFDQNDLTDLWYFWQVQSLVLQGNLMQAQNAIESLPDEDQYEPIRAMVYSLSGRITGDWNELIQLWEKKYEQTRHPRFLLGICDAKYQQGDWAYIAEHADELVSSIGTFETLNFALESVYRAGDYDKCLELIDESEARYETRILPKRMQQMRIDCLQQSGRIAEAITIAEQAYRIDPSKTNITNLVYLYALISDTKPLALLAREFQGNPELDARILLQTAVLIQEEDHRLACDLWRNSVQRELPDEIVGFALSLAFQLGLDDETVVLFPLLEAQTEDPTTGLMRMSFASMVDFIRKQREYTSELIGLYRSGTAPIHMLRFSSVVDLYHNLLDSNEKQPAPFMQFPLFVRYGGRGLIEGFPEVFSPSGLYLDITSLLLGEHFEIVDNVEDVFPIIYVAPELLPALSYLLSNLRPHQPSSIDASQKIIDLYRRNSIEVIDQNELNAVEHDETIEIDDERATLLSLAYEQDAYLVTYLPLTRKGDPETVASIPHHLVSRLVNCRNVAETAFSGKHAEKQRQQLIRSLGSCGISQSDTLLKRGSILYCDSTVLHTMANTGLLDRTCQHFVVRITRNALDTQFAIIEHRDYLERVRSWLETIITRVREGIKSGKYEVVSSGTSDATSVDEADDPVSASLYSFLKTKTEASFYTWIDDRYLNHFSKMDKSPIIGINDIMKGLVGAGAITKEEYYQTLSRMRASNLRYVHVQDDEILYHLRHAISEGFPDSNDVHHPLVILKKYIAACVLNKQDLQLPPVPENITHQYGEVEFIISMNRAVFNSLYKLWNIDAIDDAAHWTMANWVIENLYFDYPSFFLDTNQEISQGNSYRFAAHIAGLISQAINLPFDESSHESARTKYLNWLFDRLLRIRFDADPEIVSQVANVLISTFRSTFDDLDVDSELEIRRFLLAQFYISLPDIIQEAMAENREFIEFLGFEHGSFMNVDDLMLATKELWKVAADAVNGKSGRIQSLHLTEPVELHALFIDELVQIRLIHPVTKKEIQLPFNHYNLLVDDSDKRAEYLNQRKHWFDLPSEDFDQFVFNISSMEDTNDRMHKVAEVWDTSITIFYSSLSRKLHRGTPFELDELMPTDITSFIRFLRLDPNVEVDGNFHKSHEIGVLDLARQQGLLQALHRACSLPVPLPDEVLALVEALDPQQRRDVFSKLLRTSGSPISQLHCLRIAGEFAPSDRYFSRVATLLIWHISSLDWQDELNAFQILLNFCDREMSYRSKWNEMNLSYRLAILWTHTHHLYAILRSSFRHSDHKLSDWIRSTFWQGHQRISSEIFSRSPRYWFDVAHPRRVSWASSLIFGLDYALPPQSNVNLDSITIQRLESILFPEVSGRRMPTFDIMGLKQNLSNSLSSFLNKDTGTILQRWFGELGDEYTIQSQIQTAKQLIRNLADENLSDQQLNITWSMLSWIIRDMPQDEEISEEISRLLMNTSFEKLFQLNLQTALVALHFTCLQLYKTNPSLTSHLTTQLEEVTNFLARKDDSYFVVPDNNADKGRRTQIAISIVENALNIALSTDEDTQKRQSEFVNLVRKLCDRWHIVAEVLTPIVQRMVEELPIENARNLWSLLIYLRSR